MKIPRIGRRFALALVLILVFGFVATLPAAATPAIADSGFSAPARLWSTVWSYLSPWWGWANGGSLASAGLEVSSETPSDGYTEEGASISPNGAPVENGAPAPPDSYTEAGASISPNG